MNDRVDDIPVLARQIFDRIRMIEDTPVKKIAPSLLEYLGTLEWKGNVRELETKLKIAVLKSPREELGIPQWQAAVGEMKPQAGPTDPLLIEMLALQWKQAEARFEEAYFRYLFGKLGGDISRLEKYTGLSGRWLRDKKQKYNL